MGKWLLGLIGVSIVAIILSLILGPKYSNIMKSDIESALAANNYSNVSVDMHGHVATLNGEVANLETARGAVETAQNAECSNCENKKPWHKVLSNISVKKAQAPVVRTQSPYTFSVIKNADGSVVLDGYVDNTDERKALLAKARSTFSGPVTNDKIRIAKGAPDGNWLNVIQTNMDELALLDEGRFQIEDTGFLINGTAASADIRAKINDMSSAIQAPYTGAANISVENLAADAVGEVQSQTICQTLFNDLKEGKKINFESGRAEIKGSQSFDLLGEIATAANQCDSFRIGIEGHTDSSGDDALNQQLSERRANTVLAFLSEQGISRDRMTATGYGETKPLGNNATSEGREQNRRTTFTLTQAQ